MRLKLFKIIFFSLIIYFFFSNTSFGKYTLIKEAEVFLIEKIDTIAPSINGRNYNVYDEIFKENVNIECLDNLGKVKSQYFYNEKENTFTEAIDFNQNIIFEKEGFYKVQVVDLYNNKTEYSFRIKKGIDTVTLTKKDETTLIANVVNLGEVISKIELYKNDVYLKEFNYLEKNLNEISQEILVDKIGFWDEFTIIAYDKKGNTKKSNVIVLNSLNIYNLDDLRKFRDIVNTKDKLKDKKVTLMNNIQITDLNWESIKGFEGIFLGKNFTISNFKIESNNGNTGFFIDNYGTISNLKIEGSIISKGDFCGGIASKNYGIIKNCISRININSLGSYVGGITGLNESKAKILSCGNEGNVQGKSNVAGIVGYCKANYYEMNITECYNSGEIVANQKVAGIIGGTDDDFKKVKSFYNLGRIVENSNFGKNGGLIYSDFKNVKLINGYNLGNIRSAKPNQISPANRNISDVYYISGRKNYSKVGTPKDDNDFYCRKYTPRSVLDILGESAFGVWVSNHSVNNNIPIFKWQKAVKK